MSSLTWRRRAYAVRPIAFDGLSLVRLDSVFDSFLYLFFSDRLHMGTWQIHDAREINLA